MAATDDSAAKPALLEVSAALRDVHRALVDLARADYEKKRGPVKGPADLLRLLTEDPHFFWLHTLSELIVDLDHLLTQEALPGGTVAAVRLEVERLVQGEQGSSFWQRYAPLLQADPHVAIAHGKLRQALKAVPPNTAAGAQVLHERPRWAPPRRKQRLQR